MKLAQLTKISITRIIQVMYRNKDGKKSWGLWSQGIVTGTSAQCTSVLLHWLSPATHFSRIRSHSDSWLVDMNLSSYIYQCREIQRSYLYESVFFLREGHNIGLREKQICSAGNTSVFGTADWTTNYCALDSPRLQSCRGFPNLWGESLE